MSNISQETLQMLNEQVSNELFNSNKYATIGAALKNLGLDNIGEYFFTQGSEEREHADKIRKYITDRNEKVLSLNVQEFVLNSELITDIANLYVASEKETTASLTRIAFQAFSEQDLLTYNFMMEMLGYQRHEEEETLTFQDKALMTANAPEVLLLWDANFKA